MSESRCSPTPSQSRAADSLPPLQAPKKLTGLMEGRLPVGNWVSWRVACRPVGKRNRSTGAGSHHHNDDDVDEEVEEKEEDHNG